LLKRSALIFARLIFCGHFVILARGKGATGNKVTIEFTSM
jgi:hypothetical protein